MRISNNAGQVSPLSGLYTINLNTGAATFLGGIADSTQVFGGIAVQPSAAALAAVPEPSTFALLGLGALFMASLRKRR